MVVNLHKDVRIGVVLLGKKYYFWTLHKKKIGFLNYLHKPIQNYCWDWGITTVDLMFALTKRRALLEGWQSQLCLGDLWGSQVSAYFWNARQVTEGKGAWECCKSLWCLLFKLEAPKPCLVLSAPVFTPQISTSKPHHQCFLKTLEIAAARLLRPFDI